MGTIKKERSKWYVFLIPFVLIAFVSALSSSFAVADHASDGSGGEGISGDSNETKPKYKDTPPVDTSTPCVDESLLKKLDKPLQSIMIFDDVAESFTGFYVRLREKDTSCEFKGILEQKNLKITYSPEKNLVYLAFTYENAIDKMNEIRSLPFVAYVYPELVKVPAQSSEKLQVFINLNQNDNVSRTAEIRGGKNMSVYSGPGKLGKILEQTEVELHNYYTDLKSYYAEANSAIIRDVITLSFVQYVELAAIPREAGTLEDYKPKSEDNESNYMPYVDPRALEQFNISAEIPVIVEVRDVSGISISSKDSIEQQNIKDLQRKEFLGNKTDRVLSKLPTDGFKLKGKFITGHGFYGNITKAAFDKLVNDSDVGAIYLDSVEDLGGWKVPTEEELKSDDAATSANITPKNKETDFIANVTDNEILYNRTQLLKSEESWFRKLIRFLKSLLKFK